MKSIFFHIGGHKTGTTTIQKVLLRDPSLTSLQGKSVLHLSIHNPVHGYEDMRFKYTNLRNRMLLKLHNGKAVPDDIVQDMIALLRDFVATLPFDHVIWSDENLLGNTPGHPTGQIKSFPAGLYPASAEIAEVFKSAFDAHDVRVRLYTRDVGSLIRSAYNDWVMKLRDDTSWEDFEASVRQTALDWNAVAAPWARCFGDRFDVRPFEDIRNGQGQYLLDFAKWAHVTVKDPRLLDQAQPENQSFHARQIQLARLIAPHVKVEERPFLRQFLKKIDPDM